MMSQARFNELNNNRLIEYYSLIEPGSINFVEEIGFLYDLYADGIVCILSPYENSSWITDSYSFFSEIPLIDTELLPDFINKPYKKKYAFKLEERTLSFIKDNLRAHTSELFVGDLVYLGLNQNELYKAVNVIEGTLTQGLLISSSIEERKIKDKYKNISRGYILQRDKEKYPFVEVIREKEW